jgi:hypothetical protein
MGYELGDYNDVPARIAEFREKYPDGRLRPLDPAKPYSIEHVGEQIYIAVVAAAHRDKDDTLPGVGMAWEVFPGKTPYTKGSELQNAETSAWGRAIVAALAADTKKGIASAEEVRNRRAEREEPQPELDLQAQIVAAGAERGYTTVDLVNDFASRTNGKDPRQGTEDELRAYLAWLEKQPAREAVPA